MSTIKPPFTGVNLIEITDAEHNQRLDNFLLGRLGGIPRTRVYRSIRKGEVRVNKRRSKPEYKLQAGDQVRVPPLRPAPDRAASRRPSATLIERIEKRILYENAHIVVIDKPAGLAVHGGSGIDFGVIDILRRLRPDFDMELVHRLDRDTSGCLLLAKHRPALLAMQACLRDQSTVKRYRALVRGRWPQQLSELSDPLTKFHLPNGERRVRIDPGGKTALTKVQILAAGKDYSNLQLRLVTGRTHQIRVHCQAAGHPIAGDDKYGDDDFNRSLRQRGIKRLMLHAASLEFPVNDYTQELVVNAALPAEFERFA